jgi:hypothetical protein
VTRRVFSRLVFLSGRRYLLPTSGAPAREDVAGVFIGQNLAARRVDTEEARWQRGCATFAGSDLP